MSRLATWLIAVGLSMTAAGVAHAQVVQRFDYLVREDMFSVAYNFHFNR